MIIEVGKTYRFFGYGGRELKSRTVTRYDQHGSYPGGTVRCHTGETNSGRLSQNETMAGDYFVKHAKPLLALPPFE